MPSNRRAPLPVAPSDRVQPPTRRRGAAPAASRFRRAAASVHCGSTLSDPPRYRSAHRGDRWSRAGHWCARSTAPAVRERSLAAGFRCCAVYVRGSGRVDSSRRATAQTQPRIPTAALHACSIAVVLGRPPQGCREHLYSRRRPPAPT